MRGCRPDLKKEKDFEAQRSMFSGRHPEDLREKRDVADVIGLSRLFRCKLLLAVSGSSMTPVPYSVASIRSREVSTPGHGRQTPQSCVPAGRAATFVHFLLPRIPPGLRSEERRVGKE